MRKYLLDEKLVGSDLDVHFDIHLTNQKGWQWKVDRGGGDLQGAYHTDCCTTVVLRCKIVLIVLDGYRQPLPAVSAAQITWCGQLPLALHLDEVAQGIPLPARAGSRRLHISIHGSERHHAAS